MADNTTISAANSTSQALHSALRGALDSSHSTWVAAITSKPILFFVVTVAIGFFLSYGLVWLSKTFIKAFTKRTKTDLDDILLERLQHPVALSLFILSLNVALVPLSLSNRLAEVINTLLLSVNIFLIAVIVNRIISTLITHYGTVIAAQTESTLDDHIMPIVRKFVTVVVYALGILMILSVWGVQIAPLLAGAGIAGLAFAFAMQESLKNIFGGVSLAFDKAYAIGDRVKLSDGTVGTVYDISLRSTKIQTFDGDLVVVPNGNIANSTFQAYAQPFLQTRVVVKFGVTYGTDIDKVKNLILPMLKTMPNYFEDKDRTPAVNFTAMGDFALSFEAIFWVQDYHESMKAKLAATEAIYKACTKAGIEFAYPTQTLYLRKER